MPVPKCESDMQRLYHFFHLQPAVVFTPLVSPAPLPTLCLFTSAPKSGGTLTDAVVTSWRTGRAYLDNRQLPKAQIQPLWLSLLYRPSIRRPLHHLRRLVRATILQRASHSRLRHPDSSSLICWEIREIGSRRHGSVSGWCSCD